MGLLPVHPINDPVPLMNRNPQLMHTSEHKKNGALPPPHCRQSSVSAKKAGFHPHAHPKGTAAANFLVRNCR